MIKEARWTLGGRISWGRAMDTRKRINRNSRIVEERKENLSLSRIRMHSHATFDTVPPGQGPLDPALAAGGGPWGSSWCDQLAGTFSLLAGFQGVHVHVLTNAKLDAWYRINAAPRSYRNRKNSISLSVSLFRVLTRHRRFNRLMDWNSLGSMSFSW